MLPTVVSVVPVRMQEAWLIFNEAAIRRASGNPNGQQLLQLPRTADIERLPDPKGILRDLLRTASGLHGRRLQRLEISTERIAELIDDFTPLRALPAFRALEQELNHAVIECHWHSAPSNF